LFALATATELPLITVAIPTFERPSHAMHAISRACASDYPRIEIVVVDDSAVCLDTVFQPISSCNVRIYCNPARMSLGAKRNKLAEMAKGEIIAHWDDDDFYRSDRLSTQSASLRAGVDDIVAFETKYIYDLTATPPMFGEVSKFSSLGPHLGTLMYWRRLVAGETTFPDIMLDESLVFVNRVLESSAGWGTVPNNGEFVYVLHSNSTSAQERQDLLRRAMKPALLPSWFDPAEFATLPVLRLSETARQSDAKSERRTDDDLAEHAKRFVA